ncbi:hypothetical protein Pen02_08980 [Plantactinospora endophytica]|uniref:DUF2157 domain-containing protein n=1 Tax=Plantactinospora endophytica TaxID=673535 RepID=A0ABQ4DU50_9ACTN|nr:hypothetical protein Pen02_08980 [Plantactinospora endophytica]
MCGAGADLATGCPGCGRAPDPKAAEVIRLGVEIAELGGRVAQARQAYLSLDAALWQLRQRRDTLAGQVRSAASAATRPAAVPTPAVVAPGPNPAAGIRAVPADSPVRPEASTRTVQNVLFVLGGLLLGTAAIVFAVVAWATVGVAGRALILGTLTGLALAAPLLAQRRGLTATAETFAAVGLLLVVLDGYAGWSVDLFGVAGWPAARYAALVLGVGAVVAGGYHRLTRLDAPWFAGLLLAQPVVPLLAYDAGFGAGGWALALAGLAVLDLVLTRGRGGDGSADPVDGVRRSVAWVGYAVAGLASALCGILALVTTDGPLAVLAGAPLLVAALLPVAGALRLRSTAAGAIASAVLVVALAVALVRAVAETPWPLLGSSAAVVVLLAGLVTVAARRLPAGLRVGPRIGGLVVAGALAVLTGSMALLVAVDVTLRSQPSWRADLTPQDGPFDWQLPVALVLAAVALVLLTRRRDRSPILLAGAVLTVLAVPTALPLPWWLVAALDLGLAGALALAASWPGRPLRWALPASLAAVLLAGHALLVGLARPAGAAAVLGTLVLLGTLVALTTLRPAGQSPSPEPSPLPPSAAPGPGQGMTDASGPGHGLRQGSAERFRRGLGGVGLAVAVLATPGTVLLGLFAADVPPWWQARAVLVTAVLLAVGLVPVRRAVPHYLPYANAALSTVALAVGLAPALPGVDEPAGPYAAGALLLSLGVWLTSRRRVLPWTGADDRRTESGAGAVGVPALVSGAILLLRAGVVAVPAVLAVLLTPYDWIGRIWSGPPSGVGLYPSGLGIDPDDWRLDGFDTLTLLLLTMAAAVAGWAWRRTVRTAALVASPFAVGTALVGLVAAGARWPVVPALSLVAGLAGPLAVALRRSAGRRVWLVPVGVAFAAPGLAGLLPTRASTLAGLAVVAAAGLTVGALGRTPAARVAGWLTGVAGAAALAGTASVAADLPLRITALVVLGVAALSLAGGALLARATVRVAGTAPVGETVPGAAAGAAAKTVSVEETVRAGGRPAGASGVRWSRRAEAVAVEVASHLTAGIALLLTAGEIRYAAAVCTLWGVALGLRALRPAEPAAHRWIRAAAAGAAELVAVWLLLGSAQVALVEAYTLPAAVLGLLAGWLALRAWPALSSWLAYGPGLGAALLPSLVSVLVAGDQPWRRLLLGAAALVAVLVGARWRRQAPVLLGGAVLAVLALREMVDVWDRLPRWIFLAVGGFALIGLAMTYERRRRDLRRLRSAVDRMS